jgi:hypothetical protein
MNDASNVIREYLVNIFTNGQFFVTIWVPEGHQNKIELT